MRLFISILLTSILGLSASGQASGNASINGNCNIVNTGNSAHIVISIPQSCGIGKEQADRIISLLRAIVANQKEDASRNSMLDEFIAAASKPTETQYCVGSNCVQNGTQNNYDNRTYGVPKPLPSILGLSQEPVAAIAHPSAPQPAGIRGISPIPTESQYHPGVKVRFGVASPFVNPMFALFCDQPCTPVHILFDGRYGGPGFPFLSTNHPEIWVSEYGMQSMLTPGSVVEVELRSNDDQPLTIIKVEAYAP
jgi:hypothetical protein